ncbi:MAG: hypothetical protein R3C69_08905 [Geminicoccaceae bacterium]
MGSIMSGSILASSGDSYGSNRSGAEAPVSAKPPHMMSALGRSFSARMRFKSSPVPAFTVVTLTPYFSPNAWAKKSTISDGWEA